MKRFWFVAVALILLVGCSSPVEKVKTSINGYYYYANRFEEACPSYDSKDCPDLKSQALVLQRWEKAIKEANDAVQRGGKFPLQLKALKDVEKEVKP